MPSTSASLFQALQNRFVRLDRTRARAEGLFAQGKLSRFDIEHIYSGIYVEAFVSFERFLEDLFLGYVGGKVIPPKKTVKARMVFPTTAVAAEVVFAGQRYIDWLPYRKTTDRAQIYLRDGKPFSTLTKAQEKMLEVLHQMRNALAHRSDHSLDVFTRLVVGSTPLLPHERRPAGFLRSVLVVSSKETRLQNYLFEMLSLARDLSQY